MIKRESALKVIKYFFGDNWQKYPVIEFAVRNCLAIKYPKRSSLRLKLSAAQQAKPTTVGPLASPQKLRR